MIIATRVLVRTERETTLYTVRLKESTDRRLNERGRRDKGHSTATRSFCSPCPLDPPTLHGPRARSVTEQRRRRARTDDRGQKGGWLLQAMFPPKAMAHGASLVLAPGPRLAPALAGHRRIIRISTAYRTLHGRVLSSARHGPPKANSRQAGRVCPTQLNFADVAECSSCSSS